jgi:hypothetical protein
VDVTELTRYLQTHPRDNHGLCLEVTDESADGVSYETGVQGASPELEIYYVRSSSGAH